jgi:WD40 repeat protein
MPWPLSRELAAESITVDPASPVTARRLAVAAWHVYPTEQAASALTALLAEQEQNGMLTVDSDNVSNVAFSPDGKLLATATAPDSTSPGLHDILRFWDPVTRQPVGPTIRIGAGQDGGAGQITFTPDGKLLATVESAGMRLWDPVTGRPASPALRIRAENGVVFAPGGMLLATIDSGGTVRLWHLVADRPVGTPLQVQFRSAEDAGAVAFSPDGKLLAISASTADARAEVRLWNPVTGHRAGTPLQSGRGPSSASNSGVAFSPDGKAIAAIGSRSVWLWHLVNDHPAGPPLQIITPGGVNRLAFSRSSKLLATFNANGTIRMWNPATGQPVGAPFQADAAGGMAFSPTGKALATIGTENAATASDGTVRLWDPSTGRPFGGTFQTDAGSHGGVRQLAFSPRSELLAIADGDGTLQQWDLSTGHPVGALHQADPRSATVGVAFSPSGQVSRPTKRQHRSGTYGAPRKYRRGSGRGQQRGAVVRPAGGPSPA